MRPLFLFVTTWIWLIWQGFEIDIYPGDAKAGTYVPYLDFEKENDLLMELANHAIQDYNNNETNVWLSSSLLFLWIIYIPRNVYTIFSQCLAGSQVQG